MDLRLNLPTFEINTRIENGQRQVFDGVRKRFVALTPEEWVRQHFVNYLLEYKGYPPGLLSIEHPVLVNGMQQRADIVVFKRDGSPLVVIECKAPSVVVTKETYAQAARYNLSIKAPILMVTNGINHFCSLINLESKAFKPVLEIPRYEMAIGLTSSG